MPDASTYSATIQPKAVYPGPTQVIFEYASGTTTIAASATTINLGKIPDNCTITNIYEVHTAPNSSLAPMDLGITGSIKLFGSAVAAGTYTRLTKSALPYEVSVSETAADQSITLIATITPTSATTSVTVKVVVEYLMN